MLQRALSLKAPTLTVYVCFCVAVSGLALGSFAGIVHDHLAVTYDYQIEVLVVLGQVAFQWLFMGRADWSERKTYAIIALSVSMIGSLLLLPLNAYHYFFSISSLWATVYFLAVVGLIFIIHHRLITQQQLPAILTYTWVVYRVLLLIYLTFPRGGS